MDTVARRLEVLKLEGLGFSQAEIVKELSQKHEFSGRTVYRDFESQGQWQPELQSVRNHTEILMRTVNRYEQIYWQTSVKLLTGTQEATQLGALNIMLNANSKICETSVRTRKIKRKIAELEVQSLLSFHMQSGYRIIRVSQHLGHSHKPIREIFQVHFQHYLP